MLSGYLPQQMSDAEIAAGNRSRPSRSGRERHQGHGQGDGAAQGAPRRPGRHGQGLRPGQEQAFGIKSGRDPRVVQAGPAQSGRHRGRGATLRPAAQGGRELRRPVPVPQREDPVVHRQPDEAVLSLLRLRRARQRDRLPDGVRGDGLRRRGEGPRLAGRHAGARTAPRTPGGGGAQGARARTSTRSWKRRWPSTARELKKSPRAIDYLKGRGLTGEIAARYRIGYAPDDWQACRAFFRSTRTRRWSKSAS